jgi:hypothetical protein
VIKMPEGDDPWEWWEVLDIFTGMDERLARMENLLEKQLNAMGGSAGGDTGGTLTVENAISQVGLIDLPIAGNDFEQRTTDPDGSVTVEPGSNEDVLVVTLDSGTAALWYEVGTTDSTESSYQYMADGKDLFDNRQEETLGVFNNLYRFPQPIIAHEDIVVNVRRGDNAGSSEDYVSKVRYIPIDESTAQELETIWNKV